LAGPGPGPCWTRTRTLTLTSPRAQYEISLRKRSQAAKEKEDLSGNEAQGNAQQAQGGKEAQARKKPAKKRRHASPEAQWKPKYLCSPQTKQNIDDVIAQIQARDRRDVGEI
jgi:hypothetical protein